MAVTARHRSAWLPRRSAVLAWVLWGLILLAVPTIAWWDYRLRQVGRPELAPLGESGVPYLLGMVSAATVGAVVASRRPRHPVGWLLLALGLTVAANGVIYGYTNYGLLARPGSLPAADYVAAVSNGSVLLLAACLGFILLLTPTGSPPSARWRWWARLSAAALVLGMLSWALVPFEGPLESVANPLAVPALAGPLSAVSAVTLILTALGIPVGAASLVVRFRRSRGVERQQLRWLVLAALLLAVVVLAMVTLAAAGMEAALGWLSAGCVALLPLAIGAAVLRYRLYDLDRIISRTLAWGLLTVLLGVGYAGVVLGLGRLLPQGSSLVVAAATLAVAAVFQPARRRIQGAVDRRFNRTRYDAARTVAVFAARLREQVDLDALLSELLAVVEQTMQPSRTSLWLRPPATPRPQPGPSAPADAAMAQPGARR
jgi:hypothetical protein